MQTAGQATQQEKRQRIGRQGEDIAVAMLTDLGWEIMARNWRCTAGELDVIARDCDGTVVFCEVKTRSGLGFGAPLEAITHRKSQKLRQLTAVWLANHPAPKVRIDAIGVLLGGPEPVISHVRGI